MVMYLYVCMCVCPTSQNIQKPFSYIFLTFGKVIGTTLDLINALKGHIKFYTLLLII